MMNCCQVVTVDRATVFNPTTPMPEVHMNRAST